MLPLLSEWEVHATTSSAAASTRSGRWHAVDLLQPEAVSRMLEAVRPQYLLHLAWYAVPGKYQNAEVNRDWVTAGVQLLREFVRFGGRRAVLAGSSFEYGASAEPCREDTTPLRPLNLYAECKGRLAEQVAGLVRRGDLSAAWARIFFVYGPGENPARLVGAVASKLLRGEPVDLASGRPQRDFLHVSDVAAALVRLLTADCEGPVNVGSGTAPAVRAVAEHIADAVPAPRSLLRFGALPDRDEPATIVADVARLRATGWAPRFDLAAGIADTVAWWRSHSTRAQSRSVCLP